jgi:predicted nucleic acid-binding protein
MDVKVVDASAVAAVLFGEQEAQAIASRLKGARLVAPDLIWFELANTCLKKCLRNPEEREALLSVLELRRGLEIEETAVDHSATARLALEQGLTAYDASYLWLAKQLGAELITLDQKLARAAAAD